MIQTLCKYVLHEIIQYLHVRDVASLCGTCVYICNITNKRGGVLCYFDQAHKTDPSLNTIQHNLFNNYFANINQDQVIVNEIITMIRVKPIHRIRFPYLVTGIYMYLNHLFILLQNGQLFSVTLTLTSYRITPICDRVYTFRCKMGTRVTKNTNLIHHVIYITRTNNKTLVLQAQFDPIQENVIFHESTQTQTYFPFSFMTTSTLLWCSKSDNNYYELRKDGSLLYNNALICTEHQIKCIRHINVLSSDIIYAV